MGVSKQRAWTLLAQCRVCQWLLAVALLLKRQTQLVPARCLSTSPFRPQPTGACACLLRLFARAAHDSCQAMNECTAYLGTQPASLQCVHSA